MSLWTKSYCVTIQLKVIEQYSPVVLLFILLYKVVLTLESLNTILRCDYSNERYWVVLSCGAVCYFKQSRSNFWVCNYNPKFWTFKWQSLSNTVVGAVYNAILGCSNFCVCGWDPKVPSVKWKNLRSTFLLYCLLCSTRWFQLLNRRMKFLNVAIQMKAIDRYFSVLVFITV